MTEQLYRRYAASGADSLSLDEVRAVIRWGDENVVATQEIRQQIAAQHRSEADRAAYIAEYRRAGGTPQDAERAYQQHRDERFRVLSNDAVEGARESTRRAFNRNF